jgi:uncharacterized membrane protein YedE/YeeE
MRALLVSVISGVMLGAGLSISGMANPVRVRGFFNLGAWDPTLAFVMGAALIPMIIAWRVQARRAAPRAGSRFYVPDTRPVTARLIMGSAVFGLGWGLGGVCPGPALAMWPAHPAHAGGFIAAMAAGFGVSRALGRWRKA